MNIPVKNEIITLTGDYPQNTIKFEVDADLNPAHTIVIENTTFPFVFFIKNHEPSLNKRYISESLYKILVEKYKSDFGKIFHSLDKDLSSYPYIELDWKIFEDKRASLGTSLDSEGGVLSDFNIDVDFLLKWLDLPQKDSDETPIQEYPIILDYSFKEPREVTTEGDILLSSTIESVYTSKQSFDEWVEKYFGSFQRKKQRLDNIKNSNKKIDLDNTLSNAKNIKANLLSKASFDTNKFNSLAKSAGDLKSKLDALKNAKRSIPKPPKLPLINLASIFIPLSLLKVKKNIKRKPKTKKYAISQTENKVQNKFQSSTDKVNSLKNKAGKLSSDAKSKKDSISNKSKNIQSKLNKANELAGKDLPKGGSISNYLV